MMRSKLRLQLAGVVLALVVGVTSGAFAAIGVGDKAPNFELSSIGNAGTIKLSSSTDKPTVLVFWTSWCPHCQRELPIIQKLYTEYSPKGVNFIGVSADNDSTAATNAVKRNTITFPTAYAGTQQGRQTVTAYGISGVPAIYVIDKGGTVKAFHAGETDEATLRKDLADLGIK